ncbi:cytidine deaminase [Capnocytophaga canimorsus]|uniref:Cytidine deaminase n=1 Tax=Capnocytophaga canimorsus TaxID=28188 RepID=A0A250G296_9FLAO|nr:cytidine deaminase [Capnocytophaga canimorsus]ATA91464.1 cytidine deaminase [Capnocytophaga canimorsus]
MKEEKKISVHYTVFDSIEALPESVQELMAAAVAVRENAYAPYSLFKVGAAIRLKDGQICVGSNQENAAFPSGLCAERVAIYHASALFPNQIIDAIAITGTAQEPTALPVSPCGACRQSMAEYEIRQKQPIAVYFMGKTGKIIKTESVKDLLPFLFDGTLI